MLVTRKVNAMSYSSTLGRWMEQDPAGYLDGANLYQAVRSSPVTGLDPKGLKWIELPPVVTNPISGTDSGPRIFWVPEDFPDPKCHPSRNDLLNQTHGTVTCHYVRYRE